MQGRTLKASIISFIFFSGTGVSAFANHETSATIAFNSAAGCMGCHQGGETITMDTDDTTNRHHAKQLAEKNKKQNSSQKITNEEIATG